MAEDLKNVVARLEQVALRLEAVSARGGGAAASSSSSSAPAATASGADNGAAVAGFDELLNGPLANLVAISGKIGGDLVKPTDLVVKAFQAQRDFLVIVSKSKAPSQENLAPLLADTSKYMGELNTLKDGSRQSKLFNQISGLAEGISALGWVAMAPKPCPYIKESIGSAQFYTNRVLKDFKETNPDQVSWAKGWVALLEQLHDYVKNTHTTGPTWNPRGGDAKPGVASAAPAPAAAKPAAAAASSAPTAGKAGLFDALSKGSDITTGLKKVEKSQMTHKNPELRASSVVPAEAAAAAPKTAATAKAATEVKKDPVFELQGKKWAVEHQNGAKDLVIAETESRQTVYIYKCVNTTVHIKGKVNSITCDGCKKTAVVFDTCVASFEFVNCNSMQVQVTGKVPTITIDKTDGAQVYLSKESMGVELVTAKSSEMNVLYPEGDNGDFIEIPLPEQFKTVYDVKLKKLVTNTSEIAG